MDALSKDWSNIDASNKDEVLSMKQESKEALEVSRRGGGLDQNVYDDRVICKEATLQKSKQKIPPSYMKERIKKIIRKQKGWIG